MIPRLARTQRRAGAVARRHVRPLAQEVSPPSAKDSVQFLAIGDTGTGDSAQYEVAAQVAKAHAVFPFTFAIMMGDNMYGSERHAGLREEVRDSVQAAARRESRVLRVAGQSRRPEPAPLQAVQHERRALLHVQEGQRAVLRARQQLLRPDARPTGWRRRWPSRRRTGRSASSITRCIPPAAVTAPRWTCARSSSRCS